MTAGKDRGGSIMRGIMQDWPLTVDKVAEHARVVHGHREVITRSVEGPIVKTTYAEIYTRSKQVSSALLHHGIEFGDRVATLAWNTARHIETWYGAMGIGTVLHTVNPRLFPEQLIYIMNHAEDKILFFDLTFLPLIEKIAPALTTIKTYVVYCEKKDLPKSGLPNLYAYEDFIAGRKSDMAWGGFDENTACGLCYTSGTTGNPKGVLYSHRSNVLHTLLTMQGDVMGLSVNDTVLPVVPMFHANAWGLTFSAPAVGARLVLPGARMDGEAIYELLDTEKVTFTAAVPTVWLMLLQHLEATGKTLPHLKKVVIGGSAVPERILRAFEEKYEVEVIHAWGMTETSPLGTLGTLPPEILALDREKQVEYKLKQGRPPFGVELKTVDDDGKELPRDGKSGGHLLIRGAAIAAGYFKGEGGNVLDANGFFDTGDVAHLDKLGFMQITDRAKDVIKSGGEWISSIDLENVAMGHPKVAVAAAIGIYHPKWDERPLLIVEPKKGEAVSKEDVLAYLEGKIAKWWTPDDVQFVETVPLGATGKINKLALRETFKDYVLPTV
jgi:fatty-acyl-CoA synthase